MGRAGRRVGRPLDDVRTGHHHRARYQEGAAKLARLRGQIEGEHDEGLHEQMQRTLAGYLSQQAMSMLWSPDAQDAVMLDDTLVAMGTIYSEIR